MYLILIVGFTGQGKTPYVNNYLHNKHTPPVPPSKKGKYTATARSSRQYIFDVNNEYLFGDDKQTRPQMRHVDRDIKTFIQKASKLERYNVVIEDATGFLRGRQSEQFAQMLTGKRFTQNNYLILFHSLNRVPPELYEMADYVVLFKTNDNIENVDRKFRDERLNAAITELRKAKDHSYKTIKII